MPRAKRAPAAAVSTKKVPAHHQQQRGGGGDASSTGGGGSGGGGGTHLQDEGIFLELPRTLQQALLLSSSEQEGGTGQPSVDYDAAAKSVTVTISDGRAWQSPVVPLPPISPAGLADLQRRRGGSRAERIRTPVVQAVDFTEVDNGGGVEDTAAAVQAAPAPSDGAQPPPSRQHRVEEDEVVRRGDVAATTAAAAPVTQGDDRAAEEGGTGGATAASGPSWAAPSDDEAAAVRSLRDLFLVSASSSSSAVLSLAPETVQGHLSQQFTRRAAVAAVRAECVKRPGGGIALRSAVMNAASQPPSGSASLASLRTGQRRGQVSRGGFLVDEDPFDVDDSGAAGGHDDDEGAVKKEEGTTDAGVDEEPAAVADHVVAAQREAATDEAKRRYAEAKRQEAVQAMNTRTPAASLEDLAVFIPNQQQAATTTSSTGHSSPWTALADRLEGAAAVCRKATTSFEVHAGVGPETRPTTPARAILTREHHRNAVAIFRAVKEAADEARAALAGYAEAIAVLDTWTGSSHAAKSSPQARAQADQWAARVAPMADAARVAAVAAADAANFQYARLAAFRDLITAGVISVH